MKHRDRVPKFIDSNNNMTRLWLNNKCRDGQLVGIIKKNFCFAKPTLRSSYHIYPISINSQFSILTGPNSTGTHMIICSIDEYPIAVS